MVCNGVVYTVGSGDVQNISHNMHKCIMLLSIIAPIFKQCFAVDVFQNLNMQSSQDIYVYMQDNYVYMQDNCVYMYT